MINPDIVCETELCINKSIRMLNGYIALYFCDTITDGFVPNNLITGKIEKISEALDKANLLCHKLYNEAHEEYPIDIMDIWNDIVVTNYQSFAKVKEGLDKAKARRKVLRQLKQDLGIPKKKKI